MILIESKWNHFFAQKTTFNNLEAMTVKFIIKTSNAANGKAVIRVRLFMNREKAEISLPYRIDADDWIEAKQKTKKDIGLNAELVQIEARLNEIRRDLQQQYKMVTVKMVAEHFKENKQVQPSLYDYLLAHVGRAQENAKFTVGTKENYKKNFKYVEAFLKERKAEKLKLKALDYAELRDFDSFLGNYVGHISRNKLEKSTINKIHAFLRTALKEAEKEELIDKSPYAKFQLTHKSQESKRDLLRNRFKSVLLCLFPL
jgi:hypothetical protein